MDLIQTIKDWRYTTAGILGAFPASYIEVYHLKNSIEGAIFTGSTMVAAVLCVVADNKRYEKSLKLRRTNESEIPVSYSIEIPKWLRNNYGNSQS